MNNIKRLRQIKIIILGYTLLSPCVMLIHSNTGVQIISLIYTVYLIFSAKTSKIFSKFWLDFYKHSINMMYKTLK